MSAQELERKIRELDQRATEAYRRHDLRLEDQIQSEIDAFKCQLDCLPFTPPLDNPDECREHHWDAETLRQFGNARCEKCMMQNRYWLEGQVRLKTWSEEERQTREYHETVERYRCKPHRHIKEAAL